MADDPVTIVQARAALGSRLAALRTAAGHTQTSFARLTFYGRSSIANIETGRQASPRHFWTLCDEILKTGGNLTQEHDRLTAAHIEHQRLSLVGRHCANPLADQPIEVQPGTQEAGFPAGDSGHDDMADVLARVHKLGRTIDPAVIYHVGRELHRTLVNYDTADHQRLTAALVKQRAWLDTLLDDCPHPRQRAQLYEVGALTSGLLGYIAVGRASFGLARAYCLEAFRLADFTGEANLQAWTRGMQSFYEYYAGDYQAALGYALDGTERAGQKPQAVRLTINGVARAAGKLGDVDGVRRAVQASYDLAAIHEAPTGVPSSIDLGCYSPAQIAGNAATAFVSLGMTQEVQRYVNLAMPDISKSASPWSRSLVMLDLAAALIRSSEHDLDHASGLVLDALTISQGRPIVSVRQRTQEFVRDAAGRWGSVRQLNSIQEALAAMDDHA